MLLLFGLTVPAKLSAQAPYNINNTLPCQVDVTVVFYTDNPQFPHGPKCIACSGPIMISIPPFATMPVIIPASCMPLCDVEVSVTAINGVPITPVKDAATSPGPTRGPGDGICAPTVSVDALFGSATIAP